MQKKIILTGILAATLLVGGGVKLVDAYSQPRIDYNAPKMQKYEINGGEYVGQVNKDGIANGTGTIKYVNGDSFTGEFVNGKEGRGTYTTKVNGEFVNTSEPIVAPATTGTHIVPIGSDEEKAIIAQNNVVRTVEPPEGVYYPKPDRPAGIYIYSITFHEGYRSPGMKAVDVHIMARSNNHENELVQGRDEIVSITGSTGKVYSMIGTKRTGVNTNADWANFQEQEITEYQDVSENEKGIISIVVRRDGTLITIKPDNNTKLVTTHA